jgi:transposase
LARPTHYEKRLEVFATATSSMLSEATSRSKSRLAISLCDQLLLVTKQIDEYQEQIDELFSRHPDSGIFRSLPASGVKLAPRIATFFGDERARFDSAEAVQCYAGVAPVTEASGNRRFVHHRIACNQEFKTTMHLYAKLSRDKCAWARAYYDQKIAQGKTHACALRCLANRWLKIIWRMWQTRQPYDEAKHMRAQIAHGSWVVTLIQKPA